MENQKKDKHISKETYLLAARNPWLVWRLRALEAGYVPPLLQGELPPDMTPLLPKEKEYQSEPLKKHASTVRVKQKSMLFQKMWVAIVISILLILGLTFSYQIKG
ncbi:hypothetical protein GF373_03820, partial [bacterium]|nr:hypothetical protein [bacterium]